MPLLGGGGGGGGGAPPDPLPSPLMSDSGNGALTFSPVYRDDVLNKSLASVSLSQTPINLLSPSKIIPFESSLVSLERTPEDGGSTTPMTAIAVIPNSSATVTLNGTTVTSKGTTATPSGTNVAPSGKPMASNGMGATESTTESINISTTSMVISQDQTSCKYTNMYLYRCTEVQMCECVLYCSIA